MNTESLQPALNEFISSIQSLVRTCLQNGEVKQDATIVRKHTVEGCSKTDTGVHVGMIRNELIQKPKWLRAVWKISDSFKATSEYNKFLKTLSDSTGKDASQTLSSAVSVIVEKILDGEMLNCSQLLDYLLKAIEYSPVPAWTDIDVYGIAVKDTDQLSFQIGSRQFIFRQLRKDDFEGEFDAMTSPHNPHLPFKNNIVLRIEMPGWRPYDFQVEAMKAATVLHLFQASFVKFGSQTFGCVNPFALMMGGTIGPTQNIQHADRSITLTKEIAARLHQFWQSVEPCLPPELDGFREKRETPISIAFERYCDGLQTAHPIERQITFAIMGLEALFLGEKQTQELMYRLKLSVCKFLSKLDYDIEDVRRSLKDGYQIRSLYVHGGRLSDGEKKKHEAKGTPLEKVSCSLLNYLRVSLLHLIISKQNKTEFLRLLEDSLIDRERDDELQSLINSEKAILLCRVN